VHECLEIRLLDLPMTIVRLYRIAEAARRHQHNVDDVERRVVLLPQDRCQIQRLAESGSKSTGHWMFLNTWGIAITPHLARWPIRRLLTAGSFAERRIRESNPALPGFRTPVASSFSAAGPRCGGGGLGRTRRMLRGCRCE
jgi:hypothetical protein